MKINKEELEKLYLENRHDENISIHFMEWKLLELIYCELKEIKDLLENG